jgi:hypothetical protein
MPTAGFFLIATFIFIIDAGLAFTSGMAALGFSLAACALLSLGVCVFKELS